MDPGISGKRVLVTGASLGLGYEAALAFARAGCRVAVVARRQERLQNLVEEMGGVAAGHAFEAEDLLSEGNPTKVVARLIEQGGDFDIVVHAELPAYSRRGQYVNAGPVTTFSTATAVPENRVVRIPHETNMQVACLLGCGAMTGVSIILNDARIEKGDSVVIVGCGGVGLSTVQGAVVAGATPIIAVGPNREALALASRMGAKLIIDSDHEDICEGVSRATGGKDAKHVVVATGNPPAVEAAIETSAVPGSVHFLGVPPAGARISVDPLQIHLERILRGSTGGAALPDRDVAAFLSLDDRGA